MKDNRFAEFDKQIGEEIKAKLLANGITKYPAVCDQCQGKGCKDCDSLGSYELMIELAR